MKRANSILIGLTAGLALSAPVRAADSSAPAASGNPYEPLVVRNVFALNPPPPPGPVTPTDPPPKITPNGIMNLLGTLQALYKVEAASGQASKEPKSYMLSVGQREDDIEVLKIDEKASIVTFNNHGTVQDLPLVAGSASTGGGPGGPPPPGGAPPPGGRIPLPTPMGGNRFGNFHRGIAPNGGGSNPGINPGGGANNSSLNNSYNPSGQAVLGAGPAFAGNSSVNGGGATGNENTTTGLSADAQMLIMEKNRMDTQQQVDSGKMPPLPPTVLTP